MSDNTPTDDLGPLHATIYSRNGKVVMDFGKQLKWVSMTPHEARVIAATLVAKAAALEGLQDKDALAERELDLRAQALYAGCGSYISSKSAVNIADTNEALGLAVQILVSNAMRFTEDLLDKQNKRRKEKP